jgi:flagellar basal body rod protein FlgF
MPVRLLRGMNGFLSQRDKDGREVYTRSLEIRCTAANVLNAVQYSAVNTQFDSPTVGQVTATRPMR